MKKAALSLLIMLLIVPMLATAQEVELTQTFEGDGYTVQYPDGWFAYKPDADTALEIANFEPRDEMAYDSIEAGEISIGMSPFVGEQDFPIPPDVSTEFLAGYGTGLFALLVSITSGFSGEEQILTFDTPIELDLENYEAIAVPYTVNDTYTGWLVLLGGEIPFFITVKSRVGELEQWEEITLSIVDSIQVK